MGCVHPSREQNEIVSTSTIENPESNFSFEDSDDDELIIEYSNNSDLKEDEKNNENKKKEIDDIKYLESITEQEILDSYNNELKDGGYVHVDPATQRKHLNFLCHKNQHWLSPDSFYSECCSNLKEVIDKHISHEENKKLLHNIVTSLQNKKASLNSKTHKKCKLIQETISKIKNFNNKIFGQMANCFHKMLIKFAKAFLKELRALAIKMQKLTITAVEVYHIIQSLPILRHILPKNIPQDAVIPPKDGFYNWALTIQYQTNYMPFLKNVEQVRKFITDCNEKKRQCRFVSYGHSFSPMFGDDGTATGKIIDDKYTSVNPPLDAYSDVKYENNDTKISVDDRPLMYVEILPENNKICVGGAASNYLFYKLQTYRYFEKHKLTPSEPANVLQFFQGYGGTHAVGCHGSGITTSNLPYYIRELKILDAFGQEHCYNEEKVLQKISTHFGLLGFVKEMTLQYDRHYFALFWPKKVQFATYFPRNGECKQFQDDVSNSYYNEFFWYPTQKEVFVNCWQRTFDGSGAVETLADNTEMLFRETFATIMQTFNMISPVLDHQGVCAKIFQSVIAKFTENAMPAYDKPKKVLSCEGLHFIRGIQELRVLDMEWSVPIPSLKKDGKHVLVDGNRVPDCSMIRDLVIACYDLVQEYHDKDYYPQVLPLEFRILKGNDCNLNCGSGVEFTCAIEVLTLIGSKVANDTFYQYCQELTDKWARIADKWEPVSGFGHKYMRPHWGKLWQQFNVLGTPIREHLRNTYGDQWNEFETYRKKHDPNKIFLNNSFREIFNNL